MKKKKINVELIKTTTQRYTREIETWELHLETHKKIVEETVEQRGQLIETLERKIEENKLMIELLERELPKDKVAVQI